MLLCCDAALPTSSSSSGSGSSSGSSSRQRPQAGFLASRCICLLGCPKAGLLPLRVCAAWRVPRPLHASQSLPTLTAPSPPRSCSPPVQFGVCQDCYMPKDPSKQGHRGIGFVTYASPESGAQIADAC